MRRVAERDRLEQVRRHGLEAVEDRHHLVYIACIYDLLAPVNERADGELRLGMYRAAKPHV